jgi:hypothetical protein
MEYQRPRYEETADHWLVERHEREIAPLLKRRWLFAESGNFLLYDFYTGSGAVDENVFAYSNRNGGERALVVYNNRYGETQGTIDFSAAYADKGARQLRQRRLAEGLGLDGGAEAILAWRDSLTGLEYLRRARDVRERGLSFNLHAYQCHVFLDWRELWPTAEWPWDRLCDHLNGRGVPNLDDALVNLELEPAHQALRRLLDPVVARALAAQTEDAKAVLSKGRKSVRERNKFFDLAWERCEAFLREAQKAYGARLSGTERAAAEKAVNPGLLAPAFRERLRAALRLPEMEALFAEPWTEAARRVLPSASPQLTATAMWGPVLGWSTLELLAESVDLKKPERAALDLFDRLRLREPFAQAFGALGFEGEEAWRVAARIKVVLLAGAGVGRAAEETGAGGVTAAKAAAEVPTPGERKVTRGEPANAAETSSEGEEHVALAPGLWLDPDVRWLCGVHEAEGHTYLVRERYEELLWWLLMPELLRMGGKKRPDRALAAEMERNVEEALATAMAAGYRIDVLLGLDTEAEGEAEAAKTTPDAGTRH